MVNLSDNFADAIARGFTRRAVIYCGDFESLVLVRPNQTTGAFTAFDIHADRWTTWNGATITEIDVAPESDWQPQTAADVIAYLTLTNTNGV